MRSLNAYVESRLVGQLHEGEGLWRFEYDQSWAQASDGFDLAPGLPRKTLEHVMVEPCGQFNGFSITCCLRSCCARRYPRKRVFGEKMHLRS